MTEGARLFLDWVHPQRIWDKAAHTASDTCVYFDLEGGYATVTIIAYDRVNMLGEIATIIGEHNVSIRAASIQNDDKTRISTLRLTLDVHSREEMDKVMGALRNKSDILDVYR